MSKGGNDVQMPDPSAYMPLVQQQADVNRLNQVTPFGSTTYVQPEQEQPLSFDIWSQDAPAPEWGYTGELSNDEQQSPIEGWITPDLQTGYQNYVNEFNANLPTLQPTVTQELAPQLQNLFSQQFDPGAYQNYSNDYFENARGLLDPVYDRQLERFEQSMADRGQPVGGELYDDTFGNIMDAQNRGYESAAFNAQQVADQARLQDFNRLMAAMGGSQVAYPGIDTNSAANMAMNADIANINSANQQNSNLWNTAAQLGSAWMLGPTSGAAASLLSGR